jgi:NADPH2:quinone reductase
MKAIVLNQPLPINDPLSLVDAELPVPAPRERDLLVRVRAVSVNPVDTKVRQSPQATQAGPRTLGWDAAGVVEAVGAGVTLFKPGDAVYFAGDITRPGGNAEYTLVDERIAALKPATLDFAQAAALPLTAITAWEALFDRLGLSPDGASAGQRVLVIGGAGGVASIAIQLARQAGLHVIATASRPETEAWVRELGAREVLNHRGDLVAQLEAAGGPVGHVFLTTDTDAYFPLLPQLLAPQGRVCGIVDNREPLPLNLLKPKSQAFLWEMMFARPMHQTPDMIEQHRLLTRVAQWVDAGQVRTTLQKVLRPINAANLRAAHAQVESGTTIGKVVLEGWA